jgi:hypothetical protein
MPLRATAQQVVGSVGVPTSILASEKNLVILDANMADYSLQDWQEIAGTRTPNYPAGALMGWRPVTADGAAPIYPHAKQAGDAAYFASSSRLIYTWFPPAGSLANRGSGGAATIPGSGNAMACVLAKDVDITDLVAGQTMVVPVIWQGIFTPRGIVQDVISYDDPVGGGGAGSGAWPTVVGSCDRLEIVAKPNWTHG